MTELHQELTGGQDLGWYPNANQHQRLADPCRVVKGQLSSFSAPDYEISVRFLREIPLIPQVPAGWLPLHLMAFSLSLLTACA
jgi:hypothetical protein